MIDEQNSTTPCQRAKPSFAFFCSSFIRPIFIQPTTQQHAHHHHRPITAPAMFHHQLPAYISSSSAGHMSPAAHLSTASTMIDDRSGRCRSATYHIHTRSATAIYHATTIISLFTFRQHLAPHPTAGRPERKCHGIAIYVRYMYVQCNDR